MPLKQDKTAVAKMKLPAIEYPRRGEEIVAPTYTLRIESPTEGGSVEISIDGKPWQPCRFSVGYWWYDWSGYSSGTHRITVRAKGRDGRTVNASTRSIQVRLA